MRATSRHRGFLRNRPPGPWTRFLPGIASLLLANAAAAFTPVLAEVQPRGGQRGTEVEVSFRGERLDGIHTLLFYEPGITAGPIQVKDGGNATAKLSIAADYFPPL